MEQTNRGAAQRRRRSLLIYRFPRRAAGRRRQRRSIDQSERRPTDELRRGYASRRQSSEEMVAPVAPVFLHVFLGGNFLLSSCVYGGVRFLPDKLERCGLGSFYFLDTLLSFLSPRRGCISNSKRKKKKRRDGGKARAPGVALLYVICFQKNAKADEASAVAPLTGGGIRCVKGKKNKIKEIR